MSFHLVLYGCTLDSVRPDSSAIISVYQYDFHNENAFSSLCQDPSLSITQSVRHHTCYLGIILYPYNTQMTRIKTSYSHSAAVFESLQPTIPFRYENDVSILIRPAEKWETVITSPNCPTCELGSYHLVFVMKMICDIECSSGGDDWR